MSLRLVIGIIVAVVLLLISGGALFLSSREGGVPLALLEECKPAYELQTPLEDATEKGSADFDITIAVDPDAELQVGEPFALWYSAISKRDVSYTKGEVQTFGNVSLISSQLANIPVLGVWDLRGGEEKSGLLTAETLRIDSFGEGQISFTLYAPSDAIEKSIDNIPDKGVRSDLYFLVTPEGIFTNSHSPLMLRVEHLNTKCNVDAFTQAEYEQQLETILGSGAAETSEFLKPNQETSGEWVWVRDKSPTDFSHPASWSFVSDPPYEQIINPERTVFITLKNIVFNNFAPTYCGGNYSEPTRCEPITVDDVLGFIDWGIVPGTATALFGVTDENGIRASLAVAGQISESDRAFWKDFLSRLRFTRTSAGMVDHYVRILAPNGITNLCSGEQTIIKWDHKGVRTVQLWIRKAGGSSYEIGKFPADFNEENKPGKGTYPWTVGQTSGFMFNLDQFGKPTSETEGLNDLNVFIFGKSAGTITLPEGYGYELGIMDAEDPNVYDVSDNTFPILNCVG